MHRRGWALMVTMVVIFACILPGAAADIAFNDVPSDHWAYDAVTRLAEAGLVEGYPDGSFGGDRTFTRYEMATVFSRIVGRLDRNVDEQVAATTADMDKRIAAAASEASKALAAALKAQSMAGNAADAASSASDDAEEAIKKAFVADRKAEDALRQAEAALDASKAMEEVARAAKAVADEALALAKRPIVVEKTVEVGDPHALDPADIQALEELAKAAQATAKRAETAAATIKEQHVYDIAECKAAISEAKAIAQKAEKLAQSAVQPEDIQVVKQAAQDAAEAAARAEELAQSAAQSEDVQAVKQAAQDAAEAAARAEKLAQSAAQLEDMQAVKQAAQDAAQAAARAEKLAQSAAQLEDVAQIAAKANDAFALAAKAEARAREAQAEIDFEKRYRYDEASKAIMRDYVKQSIIDETDTIKRDASALARRVLALENKSGTVPSAGLSAKEAEEIANRVVGERLKTVAGTAGSGIVVCDVGKGDLDAVRALVEQKSAALNKDMEALDKEYATELRALGKRVGDLEARLAKAERELGDKIEAVDADLAELYRQGRETDSSLALTQWDVDKLKEKLADTDDDIVRFEKRLSAAEAGLAKVRGEEQPASSVVVVGATQADVDDVEAELASIKADLAALKQEFGDTKDGLAATRTEVAALTGNVVVTQSDMASLSKKHDADLDGVNANIAAVKSDVADLGQRTQAAEASISVARDEIVGLIGDVGITQSDVARLAAQMKGAEADILGLTDEVEAKGADIEAVKSEVGVLTAKIGSAESGLAETRRELDAIEKELGATRRDLAAAQAELEALQAALSSTRAELAVVDENLQLVKDNLGPIWRWFAVTNHTMGAELVYNRVRGNSLFNDSRAAQKSATVRAAEGQWYDGRQFVKNENFMRYSVGISTEPTDGATFDGRVYADRDIQLPRWQGAGIEAEITTDGIVEALKIGDLDAAHSTGKFSKYILDTQKWDAQLYRINGLQGAASVGPVSVQGIAGHGAIKRVNVVPGTGNDLAGDDLGSLFGVAGQLRLGTAAEGRFSWLNMKQTLVSDVPAPVTAYALGLEGYLGTLHYDAELAAARGGRRPQVGDVTVSQSLGTVYWTGEYGYRRPNWNQRLADPSVDGLATPNERFLGAEVAGLEVLGFDTRLVHRSVENVDGRQAVWMARAARDLEILVPFTATVELGSNNADLVTNSMLHSMVDLAVADYTLGKTNIVVDAGLRHEQTPLQNEEWDLRWRNASVAAAGSALATEHQNWVADTSRTQARAKATLYVAPKTGLYAGGRLAKDSNTSAASLPRKTAVAGVFSEASILGADVKLQAEWLRASGAPEAKRSIDMSVARGIGAGLFEAHAGLSDGQGLDTTWVNTLDSGFGFSYPLYQNTNLQINGKFVRSRVDDGNAYRDARLGAGFALGF